MESLKSEFFSRKIILYTVSCVETYSSCSRRVPDLNKGKEKKPFIVSIEGNIGNI